MCTHCITSQERSDKMSIAMLRRDYSRASLSELDVAPDPVAQFALWMDEARQAELSERNAMSVSTVGANGRPSSRIVLLKDFDAHGFTWYTNYDSRKGQDLSAHPYAALLFYWDELERQVHIEGRVERVDAATSEAYFQSRPAKSRIGAHASHQSAPIASRALLDQQFAAAEQQFGEQAPRPPHWGGYRLVPERVEFWQGRSSRLHDRVVYTLDAHGNWSRERLQP